MQANQRIGEYVLDEPLGHGAFAEVWKAHHHMWAEQVAAVKIPTDANYIANLQHDGVRVHRLLNPNIVPPLAFDAGAQPPYIITELMPGGSIRPLMNLRRLSVAQTTNIIRQVLAGLAFGHEKGIVHGDIRPENILLAENAAAENFAAEGSVKITDFGVGLAALGAAMTSAATQRTANATLLAYLAPEQREGAAPDFKSDVFAVGVVLFEMLTGERPSGADMPSELNSEVPAALDDAFRRSYAKRDRRFETARSFLEALPIDGKAPVKKLFNAPTAPPPAKPAPAAPANGPLGKSAPPSKSIAPPVNLELKDEDPSPIELKPEEPSVATPEEDEMDLGPMRLAGETPVAPSPVRPPPPAPPAPPEQQRQGRPSLSDTVIEDALPKDASRAGLSRAGQSRAGQSRAGESRAGDTRGPDASRAGSKAPAPSGPTIPPLPRIPSKAEKEAIFDELAKKQIKTQEELKFSLRLFVEAQELDEGEAVNIRLRVVKWANQMAGGQTDLDPHVILHSATARPLYVMKLCLLTTRGSEEPRSAVVEHPFERAQGNLFSDDYRLIAHFSSDALSEKVLEMIPEMPLRVPAMKLVRDARREFTGRLVRMDLLLFRANVIATTYSFEDHQQVAHLVGNALKVIGTGDMFVRIGQEPTKRATTLLDTEQVTLGLKEVRRGLETPQWKPKASIILTAFRAKLAAAYIAEAIQQFESFSWLESLDVSAKAGQVVPGHEEALRHAARVSKRNRQLQVLPGMTVSIIYLLLAVLLNLHPPIVPKVLFQGIVTSPVFAGGIVALIATFYSAGKLGMRMAHTDLTFYHSILLPTLLGGVIALGPDRFRNPIGDGIVGGAAIILIITDVVLFKYFRQHLLRAFSNAPFAGDDLNVLDRIEALLRDDWEMLKPHYLQLPSLFTYAGGKSALSQMTAEPAMKQAAPKPAPAPAAAAPAPPPPRPAPAAPPPPAAVPGSGNNDKLVQDMNTRITSAKRGLVPPARMLVSLANEYAKSVTSRNLGMMQGNANKIEQRGKDLADKLADFNRLCHMPLSVGDSNSEEMRRLSAEFAQQAEEHDIKILRAAAEHALTFRQNEADAIAELSDLIPAVEAAMDRLKT